MIGLHKPARFIGPDTHQSIIGSSEKIGYFAEMPGVTGITAVVEGNTIGLYHKCPPQPAPSIANGTFAPMLCGKKRYFQPVIFYLLIPASLCHLKLRKPSFDQLPGAQTTKEFHPRIVFYQPCHTLLIEVIKMIVTDQQIIDIGKYIGIGRKITLPLNERNIAENGVEHDPLPT